MLGISDLAFPRDAARQFDSQMYRFHAAMVFGLEIASGCVFNRWLRYNTVLKLLLILHASIGRDNNLSVLLRLDATPVVA
jgi:hypothetical protein